VSDNTPEAPERNSGPSETWWGRVVKRARDEGKAEDNHEDSRVDKAYGMALQTAKNVMRAQWILIVILILAVLALAGHAVGLDIPGLGSLSAKKDLVIEP
jgi:hypothetical protein